MSFITAGKLRSFFFYVLYFAGAAAIFNYLALFFESRGLRGGQIGILLGASALITLFSGPLWSSLADSSGRHRLVMSLAILGNVVAVFFIPYFRSFGWFLSLMILQSLFSGPIIAMADNATMTMLGAEKALYGRLRVGGTLGWGLAALVLGLVVERYGLRWNFWIYSSLLLVALMLAQGLHFSIRAAQKPVFAGVLHLLIDRKWIGFLTIVIIAGCGNAVITNYLFLYLEKIGARLTWMGLAITISTLAEFPAMIFADRWMRRFGARRLLTLGLLGTAVRFLLFGVVRLPWLALTIQLLQFISFPIILVAGVSYADQHAPPGMGATAQSLFNSAFMGFGFASGGFVGGALLETVGVQAMFFIIGLVILAAGLAFGLLRQPESVRV